jgi:hypothetical protein
MQRRKSFGLLADDAAVDGIASEVIVEGDKMSPSPKRVLSHQNAGLHTYVIGIIIINSYSYILICML